MIDPSEAGLAAFVAALGRDRFYVGDAQGALERRDQFNVIDLTTGWKVDLVIRVAAMLTVQRDALDTGYLHRWADELGISEDLDAALRET